MSREKESGGGGGGGRRTRDCGGQNRRQRETQLDRTTRVDVVVEGPVQHGLWPCGQTGTPGVVQRCGCRSRRSKSRTQQADGHVVVHWSYVAEVGRLLVKEDPTGKEEKVEEVGRYTCTVDVEEEAVEKKQLPTRCICTYSSTHTCT